MTLFASPIANNSRIVSGAVTVFQDDVFLNCNTSSAPTVITLQEIPSGYVPVEYRLYIKDYSNNASTNNITIVPPSGFKINGDNSFTINENGASLLLICTSNTDYFIFSTLNTRVFANATQRGLAVPDFVGQFGVQLDTFKAYIGTALTAGSWTPIKATVIFADATARASAVPDFIGQIGVQTDNSTGYIADGLTAGDWTILSGGGGGSSTTTFVDNTARLAAVPAGIGQLGIQLDTGQMYYGTALTAGSWSFAENNNYTSNNFIVDGESYSQSLSVLDSILGVLAPSKAGNLTGQNLTLSGNTLYTGILPSGLNNASWYLPQSKVAGDTITNLIVSGSYTLTSPDLSTRFNAGTFADQSTWGIATYLKNGVLVDTLPMTSGSFPATVGSLTIGSVVLYNSLWAKANGNLTIVQTTQGFEYHQLSHTVAGTSNQSQFYFDDVNTTPTFATAPSNTVTSLVQKYLSGISYVGVGTTINVSYVGASGIFTKVYHPTAVSRISNGAMTTLNVNPSSVPDVADQFTVTNQAITLNVAYSSGAVDGEIAVLLQKPNGANVSATVAINTTYKRINTYGTVSTTTSDLFLDEAQRLIIGTSTPFDSTVSLANGEAQVRNGILVYGNVDYPAKTGDQEYDRYITKASASSGIITFGAFLSADISSYATGSVNIFLLLEGDNIYFDLGRPFGSNNGTGSGNSRANSIGAMTSFPSSASIAFTFGTYNTALNGNGNKYRIEIVFRDATKSMTSIATV
jgi:hypothetical protein